MGSPFPRSTTDQCLRLCISLTGRAVFYCSGPRPFWHQEPISRETVFPGLPGGWFQDDSSALGLLCPLFPKGFPGGSDGEESAWKGDDPVRSLGQEDPLEKEMATHSSILAWRIPWTEEPGGLQSMGQ